MKSQRWAWLQLLVAVVTAVLVAVLAGVPSALIDNPFFVRMTPVPWWSYLAWVLTSVLSGMLAATYVRRDPAPAATRTGALAGVRVLEMGQLLAGPYCAQLMADHGADPQIAQVLDLKARQAQPFEDPDAALVAALPDARQRMRDLALDVLRQHGIEPPTHPAATAS